ncbi:MAG TPA: hypothetical protein GXX41_14060 [Thermoanaerobacterium sp.]|nr:hypothetical protein [Thermoanaerobacterium sp.]
MSQIEIGDEAVRYAETGQGKRPIMEMTKDEKILRPYENVAKWLEHVVSLKEGVRVGSQ